MAKKKPATKAEGAEEAGGGKKRLILVVVGLLVVGAAAYWFVLKPKPEGKKEKPVAGEVVALEPRQVNLEGGHYLKLGLALQGTDSVAHPIEGSKALDAAIEIFSGRSIEEVSRPAELKHLKVELQKELDHLYHGDVMDVYFTDFVTQ
jgi:flagellar protein FliL